MRTASGRVGHATSHGSIDSSESPDGSRALVLVSLGLTNDLVEALIAGWPLQRFPFGQPWSRQGPSLEVTAVPRGIEMVDASQGIFVERGRGDGV